MDNASPSSVSLTNWQYALPLHVQTRLELGMLAALPTSPQLALAALGCSSLTGVEGFSADAQRLEIDPLTIINDSVGGTPLCHLGSLASRPVSFDFPCFSVHLIIIS